MARVRETKAMEEEARVRSQRARVESAISSFKRTFGEHVTSVKWSSIMNQAVSVKASVCDLFVGE